MLKILRPFPAEKSLTGTLTGRVPFQMMATFSRMNETPIAVISGARRGALRRGLYAILSMAALSSAQPTVAAASETSSAAIRLPKAGFSPSAKTWATKVAVIEVDQLEDAVDERIAERNEGVESALGNADQEDPAEIIRGFDEIDAEPGEDDEDQQEPDGLAGSRAEIPPGFDRANVSLGDQIRLLQYGWGKDRKPSPSRMPFLR